MSLFPIGLFCRAMKHRREVNVFPSEANLRSPLGPEQSMNEMGNTHPGGAHICSPLGCHKDRQECSQKHKLQSQPSLSKEPLLPLTVS